MGLAGLAHHEGIQPAAGRSGGVQHRGGHRVRPEGEPAHGVEVEVLGQLVHHLADQGRGLAIEGDPAQVNVVVRLAAGGEGDPSVHDGLGLDELEQAVA